MKWRFIDKIIVFESWKRSKGIKAVSLEEYYILKPLGRVGVLPESLLIESSLQLARWHVEKSSEFTLSFVDFEIESFSIDKEIPLGECITTEVEMENLNLKEIFFYCQTYLKNTKVATGKIIVQTVNINEIHQNKKQALVWEGIYAPIRE